MATNLTLACTPGQEAYKYNCTSNSGDAYTAAITTTDMSVAASYVATGATGGMVAFVCAAVDGNGAYKCFSSNPHTGDSALVVYDGTRDGNSMSVDGGRIKVDWSDSP